MLASTVVLYQFLRWRPPGYVLGAFHIYTLFFPIITPFIVGTTLDQAAIVLDLSLLAGIALLAGQVSSTAWLPCVLACCLAILVTWKQLSNRRVALIICLIGFGAFQSSRTLFQYESQRSEARHNLGTPQTCSGYVHVTSCPMQREDRFGFIARATAMTCENTGVIAPNTSMRLYAEGSDIARGDTLELVARLGTVEITRNFEAQGAFAFAARTGATLSGGVIDYSVVSRNSRSFASWIDRARSHARSRIDASYPPQAAPMARALVLGENDLPSDDAEAFRLSGLSHLLAVSGTHIIIAVLSVVAMILAVLRRIPAITGRFEPGKIAAACGIPLAWAYAEFAGSGGSVRRAALMTTVALSARVLGRKPSTTRAFGLSLVCGALLDPLAAYDVSFGLSAAATAGLLVAHQPLQRILKRTIAPIRWCAPAVAATVSSSSFCLPWLMMLGPKYSVVGVGANIVAVPLGELICLPACLVHLLLFPFEHAERGVALLGAGGLLAVRAIARFGASIDWLALPTPHPTPWQLAIVAVGTVTVLVHQSRRLTTICVVFACLLIAEHSAIASHQPTGVLRITALDVGQGDSLLVDFPDGQAMIIDGGGVVGSPIDLGVRVILPVLRARRRSRLPLAIVSHPHPDHYLGLISTLETIQVNQLWGSVHKSLRRSTGPYETLLSDARKRGTKVRDARSVCGRSFHFGQARMRVLGPCPAAVDRDNDNNNSFIIHLQFGLRSALLVGDAEHEQEMDFLRLNPALLRADLLKIGHHGSPTSTSEQLLDIVQPSAAIITSGVRNRYGHPGAQTLRSLRERGIRVYRSDCHGAIEWQTDGTDVTLRTAVQNISNSSHCAARHGL